jgi:hypothetical protein
LARYTVSMDAGQGASAAVESDEGDAMTPPKGAVPFGRAAPLGGPLCHGGVIAVGRAAPPPGAVIAAEWELPRVEGEKFWGGAPWIPPLSRLERVHVKQAELGVDG